MDTDFKVRVGEFEGPLEMLLELVEKRKLHISTVSLSQVADEFIEHTKSYDKFPIGDSADFILIASTLLLIKSKSLLPTLELSEEEKGTIEDLERRLVAYKRYKDIATEVGKIFGQQFLYFAEEKKEQRVIFSPGLDVSIFSLKEALFQSLQNMPKLTENLPKVTVAKVVSLQEMIDKLTKRIENSLRMSFRDFAGVGKTEKVNVIVSFLALLELVKNGLVRVNQENHFEDINLESEDINTPKYR